MTNFKEMKYFTKEEAEDWFKNNKEYKRELLGEGTFRGYKYYIMSLGTHPVAYVEVPNTHSTYNKGYAYYDYDDFISVHGGITYSASYLQLPNEQLENSWFIGWDYNHYNDYNPYLGLIGEKWTTEEIYEDVMSCVNALIDFDDNETKEFDLEGFKTHLQDKIKNYKDKVKYWEKERRNLNDNSTFYKQLYQKTIHEYNARISEINEILNLCEKE